MREQLENILKLYSNGQANKAIIQLKHLNKKYPNEAIIFNLSGACYLKLGKLDLAIKSYKNAISIEPKYADAFNNLGNALKRKGNLNEAINNLNKALNLKPDYIDAHYNLGSVLKDLGRFEASSIHFEKVISLDPTHSMSFYSLGLNLMKNKRYELSIYNFQKALEFKPNFVYAYFNLGNVYSKLGQREKALKYFKLAVKEKPDYEIAQHMINALSGKKTKSSPNSYVESLFDDYAENFNTSLVQKLDYKLPFQIQKLISKLDIPKGKFENVLDLGCGTGLSGKELRPISGNLCGVDLSKKMIEKAIDLDLYDDLHVGDISEFLDNSSNRYDLFIALDVFVYLGDLEVIFKKVKSCSMKNAIFIFSVESQDQNGFSLQESARFSHSKKYVLNIASKDFDLINLEEVKLRRNKENWIMGINFVFQARNA